jgi:hypothetical protein
MALAMLDAVICPEWEYRYYSFNPDWSAGEEMASMRNGQGDDWFLLFGKANAALKGFAHESGIAKTDYAKRIQSEVPQSFGSFLSEPAFSMESATFCYWRSADDSRWSKVSVGVDAKSVDDGSAALLALLIDSPVAYKDFALNYYEEDIPVGIIQAVYDLAPLTQQLVAILNPSLTVADALALANEIGYPVEDAMDGN